MFNFHKQLIFGKLKIIFICVKTPCILLQRWSNHSHEVSSNARTGLLDSFKENMDVCVGECREEGNCMYGHRMAIRDKIPLRQVTKHAKIILMLYTSVTNNPYFLSPNPTSKKNFHLENILADHVAAGKGCCPFCQRQFRLSKQSKLDWNSRH